VEDIAVNLDLDAIRAQIAERVAEEGAEYCDEEEEESESRGLRLISINELLAEPRPADWLIRSYLERGTLACLFGESGAMKSFVALDMALSIAAGKEPPWRESTSPLCVFIPVQSGRHWMGRGRGGNDWGFMVSGPPRQEDTYAVKIKIYFWP